MLKLAVLLAAATIGSAATPDIAGSWTGSIAGAQPQPIFLTLTQGGTNVRGSLTFGHPPGTIHFSAELQESDFSFQSQNSAGQSITFRLKVSDTGIAGEAIRGETVSQVAFPRHDFVPMGRKLREGGSPPVLIRKFEPEYTGEARQAKLEGVVLLQVTIDEAGKPTDLRVSKGLGMGLDEKALECVQRWRFTPGTGRDGNPKATMATIEVRFKL